MTRDRCVALDTADPLSPLRAQFALAGVDAEGLIYLDGNSLGVLPASVSDRIRTVIEDEWGVGLVRSWNTAGWITASQRIGDKIAGLVGAGPGEVIVADSTSANLYKVLSAAIAVVNASAPGVSAPGASSRSAQTSPPTSTSPIPRRARTGWNWCWWMPRICRRTSTTGLPSSC